MINTREQLEAILAQVQGVEWIAVDTEADSLHAYREKLCLVQISVPGLDFLVDPLAGIEFAPLLDVLREKRLILHGADYDLRLLHRTFKFSPVSIFDTMWAARLLGYAEFGLVHLVQNHLGVVLEKGPQKMNWAIRPLPERMATYALNDTRYLLPLSELLRTGLKEKGRLEWLDEICARVIRDSTRPAAVDPDRLWRIKGSDRLEPPALAVLKELWLWREEEARAVNKPPYFVFSHEKLIALAAAAARGKPVQPLLPPHLPSKRAARLTLAIGRGLEVDASEYPQLRRSVGRRLTSNEQANFDQFKRVRDAHALELGIDPTLIAAKGDLVALAKRPDPKHEDLMEWQRRLLFAS